jgi:hypothetical protein
MPLVRADRYLWRSSGQSNQLFMHLVNRGGILPRLEPLPAVR